MRFDCSVLYDPTYDLTVEWKKDNNDVNEDDPRISVDRASIGNQALTITDLTYDDAGKTFWWKFNIDERIVNIYD